MHTRSTIKYFYSEIKSAEMTIQGEEQVNLKDGNLHIAVRQNSSML